MNGIKSKRSPEWALSILSSLSLRDYRGMQHRENYWNNCTFKQYHKKRLFIWQMDNILNNNFMGTHIINPEFVVRWELNHTIIYWDWAHSRDLRKKWLLPAGHEEHTAHHVILPIVTIESAVLELLEQWISQEDIISFAGVMAKAQNGIPSVHALWGPAATTKLKIAVAMETFGNSNALMTRLLEIMTSNDVTIIETNKPEHDSKMAIIQGLINLWLVMVWEEENEDVQTQLLQNWKTPIGTIFDMIHANPFAEILIKRFFESLAHHKYNVSTALENSISTNLTTADIEKFWTPNSDRVMQFISWAWRNIVLSREIIWELQSDLNTNWHRSLNTRIKKIRWIQ